VDGESQPLLQQQQQQVAPLQDSYMQSRAEALQNVESTIHELSNIFNQLATLVSQQGEVAIRFSICPTCVLSFISNSVTNEFVPVINLKSLDKLGL